MFRRNHHPQAAYTNTVKTYRGAIASKQVGAN